jgi:hypothetical protein
MGGKAGSDSGQISVQNYLKPRSGSDKIEPAAGGAQKFRPDKKYRRSGGAQCVWYTGSGWVRGSMHQNDSAIQYNMRYI